MDRQLSIESQTMRQTRRVNFKLDANHCWSTPRNKIRPNPLLGHGLRLENPSGC